MTTPAWHQKDIEGNFLIVQNFLSTVAKEELGEQVEAVLTAGGAIVSGAFVNLSRIADALELLAKTEQERYQLEWEKFRAR